MVTVKVPGRSGGEGGVVRAGDGRGGRCWIDRQVKRLGGIRADAVAGGDGDRVDAAGTGGGRAGQGGGAVTVVDERHAGGQGPVSVIGGSRERRSVVTVKVPAVPAVKVVWSALVMAGRLVDGQGERLGGVGSGRVVAVIVIG